MKVNQLSGDASRVKFYFLSILNKLKTNKNSYLCEQRLNAMRFSLLFRRLWF